MSLVQTSLTDAITSHHIRQDEAIIAAHGGDFRNGDGLSVWFSSAGAAQRCLDALLESGSPSWSRNGDRLGCE